MRAASVGLLALSVLSSACSSDHCDTYDRAIRAPFLHSEALGNSFVLSEAGAVQTLYFTATLSGLPEEWSDNLNRRADVQLDLELRYLQEPFGGDGQTQMPRVRVTLGPTASAGTSWVSSDLPESTIGRAQDVFQECERGQPQCRAYVFVRVERLDGAPFPPLSVTWRAQSSAAIGSCDSTDATRLSLTEVTP